MPTATIHRDVADAARKMGRGPPSCDEWNASSSQRTGLTNALEFGNIIIIYASKTITA
jgi:hypothetical protein